MNIARLLALFALLLTLGPAILFATGALADSTMKLAMLLGAVLWFATAPRWLRNSND